VLVDTSVWVDHLRRGNDRLAEHLAATEVWSHPFVIGELACGYILQRTLVLRSLEALPQAPMVDHHEVMQFVGARQLYGKGLGWIDIHLLASASLAGIPFWTLDKRMAAAARSLALSPN
jgi:predicted nucleic acid-binding protein